MRAEFTHNTSTAPMICPMDLGLMYLSVCGHRRLPRRRRKMMTVFVANCVATVLVIYPSVPLAT